MTRAFRAFPVSEDTSLPVTSAAIPSLDLRVIDPALAHLLVLRFPTAESIPHERINALGQQLRNNGLHVFLLAIPNEVEVAWLEAGQFQYTVRSIVREELQEEAARTRRVAQRRKSHIEG